MSKESALAAALPLAPPTVTTTAVEGSAGVTGTTTQAATSEAATDPKTTLESTRLAQLLKKESALVKERESLKKEQESFNQTRSKMAEMEKKLTEFEALKVKDPVAALKYAGFTDTDLINFMAQAPDNSTPEEKAAKIAQSEIQKFREEQLKKEADLNESRNTQVITEFKDSIKEQIDLQKDEYEYCAYHGPAAEELVYLTTQQILQDEGQLPSLQEVLELVEAHYEEGYKAMSGLKKTKVSPEATVEPKVEATATPPKLITKNSPTLSNKTIATTASTTVYKKETPSEKRARLIAKLSNFKE